MIYRILIDHPYKHYERGTEGAPDIWRTGFSGAASGLSDVMWALDLLAPAITNQRARFYFTERGWRRYGRSIVAEGTRRGHVVKVIRRKQPRTSQIVYQDADQMALLPDKHGDRKR